MDELNYKNPSEIYLLIGCEFQPKLISKFQYSYGKLKYKKLPLNATNRFYLIKKKDISKQFLSLEPFRGFISQSYPSYSKLFQMIHSIISALSIESKLKLLSSSVVENEL